MSDRKSSLIFIILFGAIGFILLSAYFSIASVNEIQNTKEKPLISIVTNNLGIKSKLLLLELDLAQYNTTKSSRDLRAFKRRMKIMQGSILTDINSSNTIELHQHFGDPSYLDSVNIQIKNLSQLVEELSSKNPNTDQIKKDLNSLYKQWNVYSQKVIQNVEINHANQLDDLNGKYEQQFIYQIAIGGGSVFAIGAILLLYMGQLKLIKQLKKSTLEAKASSVAKSRFLANMSHEIRTPLNGVIGMSNLAKNASNDENVSSFLDKVIISSNCLLQIINDILDFSKIEANKLTVESIDFNLRDLLETHSATVYELARSKNLQFEMYTPAILPKSIKGDSLRLLQILNNLGTNAVKFTEQGQVRLLVDFTPSNLILTYKDSGIGMTKTQLDTIFEDFSQADISTTRKFGGTGLGLNICRNLSQLMGGNIEVKSVKNVGSEFKVTLPIEPFKEQQPISLNSYSLNIPDHLDDRLISDIKNLGLHFDSQDFNYLMYYQLESNADVNQILDNFKQQSTQPIIAFVEPSLKSKIPKDITSISKPYCTYKLYDAILKPEESIDTNIKVEKIDFSEYKILLVEDAEFNQLIAQTILEELGAQVVIAQNGKICVENLVNNTYDLILMDIQMPVMDGITATKMINQEDLAPNTPIIALTANVFKEDIEKYMQLGMKAHIPKPFDQEDMVSIIQKVILDK